MEFKWIYQLGFLVIFHVSIIHMATFTDMNSLYTHVTTGRNKYLRPEVDQTQATDVMISFTLFFLLGINSLDGTMSIGGYFTVVSKDENLVWTPSTYNNAELIVLPQDQIWKPPLINCNSVQEMKVFGSDDTYVQLYHNGTVMWLPGQNLEFTCDVDTTFFPFDKQECTLQVISWGYPMDKITFAATDNTINTDMYMIHSEWDLTETSISVSNTGIPTAKFKLYYKRRPMFLVITLVLPTVFLAILNIAVFFLPQDSGERIGFSITLLLAVIVFLTIAQAILPATAMPRLSAICIILVIDMMTSGMTMGSVIVSAWFYYRSDDKPVPIWLQKIVKFNYLKLIRRSQPTQVQDAYERTPNEQEKRGGHQDIKDSTNEETVNWRRVAEFWDTFNIIVYSVLFVFGTFYFMLDIAVGT